VFIESANAHMQNLDKQNACALFMTTISVCNLRPNLWVWNSNLTRGSQPAKLPLDIALKI